MSESIGIAKPLRIRDRGLDERATTMHSTPISRIHRCSAYPQGPAS